MRLRYKDENLFINYIEFYKICLKNFGKGSVVFDSTEYCLKYKID